MKLTKIVTAAAMSLGLSFGAMFNANAALIAQTFSFDGGAIEIGVMSDEAFDDGSGFFEWDFNSYEYLNLKFHDDFVVDDSVVIEAGDYLSQDDESFLFDLEYALNELTADTFEFVSLFVSVDLFVVGDSVPLDFTFEVYEGIGATGFEIEIFDGISGQPNYVDVVPGQIKVNGPTTFSLMALGFIALGLRRRR